MFKYCQKYYPRAVYDKEYYKFMKNNDEVSIVDLQNSNLLFYYKSAVRFLIGLINWWKTIKHYKMTLDNLPENMKLLINKN